MGLLKIRLMSCRLLVIVFFTFVPSILFAQNKELTLGAYYFDGWTGKYPIHITESLKTSFSQREPKWGWVTSSQNIVDKQIQLAHKAGLSFFSFCWYFNGEDNFRNEPLNNALQLYEKSPYRNRLKYCLMVTNHAGFFITPKNWDFVVSEWISQFKSDSYLKIGGKPLLIFFSVSSLVEQFGSEAAVKSALDTLRAKASINGFKEITIASCVSQKTISQAETCGFDVLTGYNYHSVGFISKSQQIPIDSMQVSEGRLWNVIARTSKLKYIPVSTLNWDPRPWANGKNSYDKAPYFVGYSEKSVYKSVSELIKWMYRNPGKTTADKVALLYAWNENGEGAYLTPSKKGPNFLRGLRKAINDESKK